MWSRCAPEYMFKHYAELSARAQIHKLYFILSFDCDTDEDIDSVWKVHNAVTDLGIIPVYAVPGQLLIKGEKVFQRIARTSAEFINHGYAVHTFFNEQKGRYESCFFYDKLSSTQIRDDVMRGDKVIRDVLGLKAKGFRTPHFGTFQKKSQLLFLYSVLKEMGYEFSSSTMPYFGFRYGAVFETSGIKEFPLSGMWSRPLNILDTWDSFKAENRSMNEEDYLREGKSFAQYFTRKKYCGIFNYYADPSHITGKKIFFDAIAEWARAARSITYQGLLEEVSDGKK